MDIMVQVQDIQTTVVRTVAQVMQVVVAVAPAHVGLVEPVIEYLLTVVKD
jgi:hypothetical protein